MHPAGSKIHHRHQFGAHGQKRIGGGVLYGVSAFVGSHRSGSNTVAVINRLAQVDGFGQRIVMVGELTLHMRHLDIVNAVFMQHLLGYFLAAQA
jgi:hypothetical protein